MPSDTPVAPSACPTPERCAFIFLHEDVPGTHTSEMIEVIENSESWPDCGAEMIAETRVRRVFAMGCTRCGKVVLV